MLKIDKEPLEEKEAYQIVYISKRRGMWDEEYLPYLFNTEKKALEVLMNNEGVEKRHIGDDWSIEIDWRYEEEGLHAYGEGDLYLNKFYWVVKTTVYV